MKYILPLAILMVLHTLFVTLDAYSITHLDSAMHFTGGIALGIFIWGLLGHAIRKGWCPDPGNVILFLLIVSLVTTGAVCWEIYEWLSDRYLGTRLQVSLGDTLKDLVLGLAGGVVYAYMVLLANVRKPGLEPGELEHRPVRSRS